MMRRRQQSGTTLINLLVALLVFSMGLMGLGVSYGRLTQAASKNEDFMLMAGWSNSLWGLVQANPTLLTVLPAVGAAPLTVSSSNTVYQPGSSQPLKTLLATYPTTAGPLVELLSDMLFVPQNPSTVGKTLFHALPIGSSVTLRLLPDAAGGICSATAATITAGTTSCVLQMTIQWPQTIANAGSVLRSQSFLYQFGF